MNEAAIQTSYGFVRGKEFSFSENLKCLCYLGIPYAKPPIGCLRFQAPQALDPWPGTLDAFEFRDDCLQFDDVVGHCTGSEDCLYLNVFIPNVQPRLNLPVLILVNAWGFVKGSAKLNYYSPDYFIAENIIVVTFSFRLGPLGFLSACDPAAPGNAGLKDVLSVLRWVKINISQFGGDPENITVLGSSGGSVIVNYLMYSKLTDGLIHKAIAQSGSILNPWAFTPDPLKTTFLMANVLGCDSSASTTTVLDFLKSVSAESMVMCYGEMKNRNKGQFFMMVPFWPCQENEFEGQEAFLTKTPEQLIKSNDFLDIPYLTGFNRDEGFLFLVWDKLIEKDNISEYLETFAAWTLNLDYKSYASGAITKRFTSFYLNNASTCIEYKKKFMEVLTDFAIIESLNRFVKAATSKKRMSPIYYYMFEFFGPHTVKSKSLRNKLQAISHHEELSYLFQCFWDDKSEDTDDSILVRKKMVSMWSNFMKIGDPTPHQNELLPIKWEPASDPNELKYLKINKELSMEKNPFEERMKFWESIHLEVKASRGQKFINRRTNLSDILGGEF